MRKIIFILVLSITVFLVSASFLTYKMLNSRSAMYPYDVENNYYYEFIKSNAQVYEVDFDRNDIKLDRLSDKNKTVFLEVDVNTSIFGKLLQPSIEVSSRDFSIVQYFEHGAQGVRYINISSLVESGASQITLKGRHVSIAKAPMSLVAFDNTDVSDLNIMVISPHPDDAEIAAYGLYSSNSKNSYVITITAGEAGYFKYDELYDDKVSQYLKKGQLRTWDSITVPMLGGVPVNNIVNLGFFDGTLSNMFSERGVEIKSKYALIKDINYFRRQNISELSQILGGVSNWESLVDNLVILLAEIEPDIIVTPYPALDTHPDHKLSTVAVIEALKKIGKKDGWLYLYSNHCAFNEFFPYGKEGGVISVPPSFDKSVYFESIYSQKLTRDKQTDKVFALEAMHDLRLDTEWRSLDGIVNLAKKKIKLELKGQDNSYFKRSVRSNEIFFVVDIGSLYNQDVLKKLYGVDMFIPNLGAHIDYDNY